MNQSRSFSASIELNGKIYCIGGRNGKLKFNSIEEYDYNIDEWNLINSSKLNQGKAAHSVCSLNNSIYSIGGLIENENENKISCSIAERWDPRIPSNNNGGIWGKVGSLNQARCAFGCLSLNENQIYCFGGYEERNKKISNVEVYDSRNNKWRLIDENNPRFESDLTTQLPIPFANFNTIYDSEINHLFLVGDEKILDFDFRLKKWNIINYNLSQQQYFTSAVLIPNHY